MPTIPSDGADTAHGPLVRYMARTLREHRWAPDDDRVREIIARVDALGGEDRLPDYIRILWRRILVLRGCVQTLPGTQTNLMRHLQQVVSRERPYSTADALRWLEVGDIFLSDCYPAPVAAVELHVGDRVRCRGGGLHLRSKWVYGIVTSIDAGVPAVRADGAIASTTFEEVSPLPPPGSARADGAALPAGTPATPVRMANTFAAACVAALVIHDLAMAGLVHPLRPPFRDGTCHTSFISASVNMLAGAVGVVAPLLRWYDDDILPFDQYPLPPLGNYGVEPRLLATPVLHSDVIQLATDHACVDMTLAGIVFQTAAYWPHDRAVEILRDIAAAFLPARVVVGMRIDQARHAAPADPDIGSLLKRFCDGVRDNGAWDAILALYTEQSSESGAMGDLRDRIRELHLERA
eukprot:gene15330-13507_t